MSDVKSLQHRAAKILRELSVDPQGTAVLVILAACFTAGCSSKKQDGESDDKRFMRIAKQTADMLAPECPNCGAGLADNGPAEHS